MKDRIVPFALMLSAAAAFDKRRPNLTRSLLLTFFLVGLALFPGALRAQTTIVAGNSGQCIEPANGSANSDANIVQMQCTGATAQQWSLVALGSNYHIVSQNSGLCLNLPNSSTAQGTQLVQLACQSSTQKNDQWSLVAVAGAAANTYQVISASSGQCVNINGNSSTAGAAVIQWACQNSGQTNDLFSISPSGTSTPPPTTPTPPPTTPAGSTTTIVAGNSGQCIEPANGSANSDANIVQMQCTGATAQQWSLVALGSNYHIVSQNSGLCLNLPNSSTAQGTQLVQLACQSSTQKNDQWSLVAVAGAAANTYQVISASSGQCVNINGNSSTAGAAVIQWACQNSGQTNDLFSISPSGTSTPPPTAPTPPPTTPAPAPTGTTSLPIISLLSGQCVEANNGSSTSGTAMIQTECAAGAAELWSFAAVGSNYHIVSQNSGLCLNVPNSSTAQGTQLVQLACQSSTQMSDQWELLAVSGAAANTYQIVSASSGQCVNISGNSTTAGAAVIQWQCQGAGQTNDEFLLNLAGTLQSTWTPVISLPVNPIAVANLPSGNLLMWSSYAEFDYQSDIGDTSSDTYYAIFNPATQTSTLAEETNPGADLFCPGIAILGNGNVLVNGGSSSPRTTIYNPSSGSWSASADMNIARGYEADTLTSTGAVYTMGGSWSGAQEYKNGELWNSSSNSWTILSNVPDNNAVGPDPQGVYRGDNHMWLFAQSNGMVFQAGPSSQMNWISTSGSGSITSAGSRGSDPYSINGNAVLYDIGMILKVGGASAYQNANATNSAYVINISGGPNSPVQVKQLTGMTYSRGFSSSVALPSGDVVVIGGQSLVNPFTDTDAILTPELWNHTTQTFTLLNPMQTPRTYHSTAILLSDGRVYVGGGGQCGAGCGANHLNAEILTPPYLLNLDGSAATRPVIQSAPNVGTRGQSITVTTTSAISSFALMRLSAITHTVNNDQRRIPLQATQVSGTTYSLAIPSDAGVVLPGYYMLFALNPAGVPSLSTSVLID